MKRSQEAQNVELIPIDRITVINPRVRNNKKFKEITSNIAELGLKKPITVSLRGGADDTGFDLACGQGRLEAYQALGQQEIPAFVIEASTEDCMVMSLVENFARRQHRAIDLLHDIEGLKRRGYDEPEILATAFVAGSPSFLGWMSDETRARESDVPQPRQPGVPDPAGYPRNR